MDYGKARWSLLRLDHRAGVGGAEGDISVKKIIPSLNIESQTNCFP